MTDLAGSHAFARGRAQFDHVVGFLDGEGAAGLTPAQSRQGQESSHRPAPQHGIRRDPQPLGRRGLKESSHQSSSTSPIARCHDARSGRRLSANGRQVRTGPTPGRGANPDVMARRLWPQTA